MRKDALPLELHFILDKERVPREVFLLERILYLEDDDTEFAPPQTKRREITMDDAKAILDHAAALAVQEARSLAQQIAKEREDATAELTVAIASERGTHEQRLAEKTEELAAARGLVATLEGTIAAKDAEIAELKKSGKKG